MKRAPSHPARIATNMSTAEPTSKSFAFVANLLDVDCELPFEIVPGHSFNRATAEQREAIRAFINRFRMETVTPSIYEREPIHTGQIIRLDESKWRYFVCEFMGSNEVMVDIEQAAALTHAGLLFTPTFTCTSVRDPADSAKVRSVPTGVLTYPHLSIEVFGDFNAFRLQLQKLASSDFKELQETYREMVAIRDAHPGIIRACAMFQHLSIAPSHSSLSVLGYFAVIESLLTHDPRGEYDSIGHQIKSKIRLLSNRFQTPMDYTSFGGADPAKIWSKLYHFRSRLAHGSQISFAGDLQILKDPDHVEDFLRIATRRILRHALREPALYADLQQC
jgi:hypothetical protein